MRKIRIGGVVLVQLFFFVVYRNCRKFHLFCGQNGVVTVDAPQGSCVSVVIALSVTKVINVVAILFTKRIQVSALPDILLKHIKYRIFLFLIFKYVTTWILSCTTYVA